MIPAPRLQPQQKKERDLQKNPEEYSTSVGGSSFASTTPWVWLSVDMEAWVERPLTSKCSTWVLQGPSLPLPLWSYFLTLHSPSVLGDLCPSVQPFSAAHPYHLSGEQSPGNRVPWAQGTFSSQLRHDVAHGYACSVE